MLLADYRIAASLSVVFVVVAILKHKYADAGTAATSLCSPQKTIASLRQMRVLSPDIKRIKSPERTHSESAYNDNMTPS